MQDIGLDFFIRYAGEDTVYERNYLPVKVTDEEFLTILYYVRENWRDLEGLEAEMADFFKYQRENVRDIDRWYNKNGRLRDKPLKKEREIEEIKFRLSHDDYMRMMFMKNPESILKRPQETIKIYRNNGSYVTLTTKADKVEIRDSENTRQEIILGSDDLINRIIR